MIEYSEIGAYWMEANISSYFRMDSITVSLVVLSDITYVKATALKMPFFFVSLLLQLNQKP